MIMILSPSKTMDIKNHHLENATFPIFQKEANYLVGLLKKFSVSDLMTVMAISEKLAIQNHTRFCTFGTGTASPAMYTYTGEVFVGLDALNFTPEEISYAQAHLRILSGLYGALRPTDLIYGYRLEMACKLTTHKGSHLYSFWSDKITQTLVHALNETQSDSIVNLASDEYFKCIKTTSIPKPIIQVHFFDWINGQKKFISFNAKKARGLMASFIVKNKVRTIAQLAAFDLEGYRCQPYKDTDLELTFYR